MSNIQRIPFHEDELYVLIDERTGKQYVLPKPMADMFGLGWRAQFAKLTKNRHFAKGMLKINIPSAGGEQETVVLERRYVHAWLLSIDVNRVAPERQEKLIRYQEECIDVLDAYFDKGHAENPRLNTSVTAPWDALSQLVTSGRQHALEIVELQESRREQDTRQLAQQQEIIALQAQQLEGLRGVTSANTKADMAIANQQWLTVRKYVFLHDLERQMPPSACKAYGTFLTGYCLENGIPVDDQPVADRQWGKENSYYAEAIAKTLPGWLNRQHSQPALTILPSQVPS